MVRIAAFNHAIRIAAARQGIAVRKPFPDVAAEKKQSHVAVATDRLTNPERQHAAKPHSSRGRAADANVGNNHLYRFSPNAMTPPGGNWSDCLFSNSRSHL